MKARFTSTKFKLIRTSFYFSLALFLLFAGSANVFAVCSLNTNLIVNGDAEADQSAVGDNSDYDVSGWEPETGSFTVTRYGAPGGFPTSSDPGPANRGNFFFSGGNGGTTSSGTQTIDLSGCAAQIDAGALAFNLSGYLGGYGNSDENARLTLNFKNASNATVGTAVIGPVLAADRGGQTGLLQRGTSGSIPAGTRSVEAVLLMTYMSGNDNDGYADNLSFSVANPIIGAGQILYSRAPNNSVDANTATVWAINPDGTNDHQITSGDQPRISSDGKYIIFRRKYAVVGAPNQYASLWIRNMATGAEMEIYNNNSDYITGYDFAPAGQKIFLDYGCVIQKMDYDGSNRQTIDSNCYDDAPTPRKTDQLLTFHGYGGEIFTSNADGSNRQAVPNTNTGNNYAPEWLNNGDFIFYTHYDGSNNFPYYWDSLYKIKPDGTGKITLAASTGIDRFGVAGVASADDTKIYMPAKINGVSGIYAVATDGSGAISAPIAVGSNVDSVGGIAPTAVAAPSGLIGWFASDGDARDNASNSASGAAQNGAGYTVGKVGQAFYVNGASQYFSIPDSAAQRPANVFTVEGWFKFDAAPSLSTLVTKPIRGSNNDSYILYTESGVLKGAHCNQSSCDTVVSGFAPSPGVWYHIAFIFDGAAQTLSINGATTASSASSLPMFYDANPYPLLLGADFEFDQPAYFHNGQIDEVSIYNRALSQAEISSIYFAGTSGKIKQAASATGANSSTTVNDATITFANVTTAGTTTDFTVDPTLVGVLPMSYTNTGLAYEISTTAVYSGTITECFHVPAITDATVFSKLRVMHNEGSATLADKTVSTNFATRTVCGQTASLSPFVIANGLAPTAASVTIGGRVRMSNGKGIFGARISLIDANGATRYAMSNARGFYQFENVPAGETYILSASRKGYSFSQPTQILSVTEDESGVDFIAD